MRRTFEEVTVSFVEKITEGVRTRPRQTLVQKKETKLEFQKWRCAHAHMFYRMTLGVLFFFLNYLFEC